MRVGCLEGRFLIDLVTDRQTGFCIAKFFVLLSFRKVEGIGRLVLLVVDNSNAGPDIDQDESRTP